MNTSKQYNNTPLNLLLSFFGHWLILLSMITFVRKWITADKTPHRSPVILLVVLLVGVGMLVKSRQWREYYVSPKRASSKIVVLVQIFIINLWVVGAICLLEFLSSFVRHIILNSVANYYWGIVSSVCFLTEYAFRHSKLGGKFEFENLRP